MLQNNIVLANPPHGGFDGGAVANDGTVEKDINLNIALTLERLLKFNGFDVIMTRTNDNATDDVETNIIGKRKKSDLKNRLELMRDNPDSLYVSIHLNKFTTSAASGAQVFYTPNFDEAKLLGQCIQDSIVGHIQPDNTRVIKQGNRNTYILYNAKVPAVIVECGFLSNRAELQKLKDSEYQNRMAFSILCGIISYCSK